MATPQPISYPYFAAIEHVVYEYANLMCAGFYSIHGDASWRTNADDAFLLGYRKLGDFLMNDYPRKDDDILALDYLPAGTPRTWYLPTWEGWRPHMNKQLTHIAYARVTAPASGITRSGSHCLSKSSEWRGVSS